MTDFLKALRNIYVITNYPKLRAFQYRLMYNALVLNMHLFRWGLRSDNQCSFCGKSKETLTHLFIECEEVIPLWNEVLKLVSNRANCVISLSSKNIFFNSVVGKVNHIGNVYGLMLKSYIYTQRCLGKPPCKYDILSHFNSVASTEKFIGVKNGKLSQHCAKWAV